MCKDPDFIKKNLTYRPKSQTSHKSKSPVVKTAKATAMAVNHEKKQAIFVPREYQQDAWKALTQDTDSVVLVGPTGCGKTRLITEYIKTLPETTNVGRAVIEAGKVVEQKLVETWDFDSSVLVVENVAAVCDILGEERKKQKQQPPLKERLHSEFPRFTEMQYEFPRLTKVVVYKIRRLATLEHGTSDARVPQTYRRVKITPPPATV